jgi:hypothetical protein
MTRARLHPTRCTYCIRSFGVAHHNFIRSGTEMGCFPLRSVSCIKRVLSFG